METQQREIKWFGPDEDLTKGMRFLSKEKKEVWVIRYHPTDGSESQIIILHPNKWMYESENAAYQRLTEEIAVNIEFAFFHHYNKQNSFNAIWHEIKVLTSATEQRIEGFRYATSLLNDLLERKIFTFEEIKIQ